jgi:hypothetical protein
MFHLNRPDSSRTINGFPVSKIRYSVQEINPETIYTQPLFYALLAFLKSGCKSKMIFP